MSSLDKHIGRKASARREELGLSVSHVAIQLGMTPDELLDREIGQRRIAAKELFLLSGILQTRVAYFFEGYSCSRETEAPREQIERILSAFNSIRSNDVRNYVIELLETAGSFGDGRTPTYSVS